MTIYVIDIETLSTEFNAVVLSIGMVALTSEFKIKGKFHHTLPAEEQAARGRHICDETMAWWAKQDPKAFDVACDTSHGLSVEQVLGKFQEFIKQTRDPRDNTFWGNGSDFDNVIIKSLHTDFGYAQSLERFGNRCFRTLKNIYPHIVQPPFVGQKHNALDDALHEAAWLAKIVKTTGIKI